MKYAAEKIIIAYNQVFNLPYTILRPSALYGERCISRRVGQIFIENALFDKELNINVLGQRSPGLNRSSSNLYSSDSIKNSSDEKVS